jgi:hypothetical protein
MRNRTADLLLTMETLCLLSYRGAQTARVGRHQRTKIHTGRRARRIHTASPLLRIDEVVQHQTMPLKARRPSSLLIGGDIKNNAAPVRGGFQTCSKSSLANSVRDRSQHLEIHAADELGVFAG